MAGSLSDFAELELLDHVLKTGAYVQPTIYIALCTADPTDAGTGSSITEPSGGSYARVASPNWSAAASRTLSNDVVITFPEATASWGTITHWAACDASTAGNMIAHGDLSASKTIGSGDNASFAIGDIDVTWSAGDMSDYLANALLDHLFENTAYTQPTNIYVALCTVAITDTDTGTSITEPSGGAYAREVCNGWDAAASGASQNTAAITFTTATASWGTITHACLCDALTAGNLLRWTSVDTSKAVGVGDTAKFNAGAFDITLG